MSMAGPLISLLIILLFDTIVDAEGSDKEISSPYTWICVNQKCLRQLKSELVNTSGVPQDVCKLNCDNLGSLWPKPTGNTYIGKQLVSLYPSKITVEDIDNPDSVRSMVQEAFEIFKSYLKIPKSETNEDILKHQLKITLQTSSDTTQIGLQTDESYTLTVTTTVNSEHNSSSVEANILGKTFFGIRHGLETLSQLIAYDMDNDALQIVSNVSIDDEPVFAYRGIMLDTARNYYSIEQLKRLIDGMSYNKLSVFHWHITDSNSFPMEVQRLPKMMEYGAYAPDKIYRKSDIEGLVKYARQRGVKIIPELDQPAHSGYGYQWGKDAGFGNLIVCLNKEPWNGFCVQPPCGQLNIVNKNVIGVVGEILKDMFDVFDTDIIHLGGDEVDFECYRNITEIVNWMKMNNLTLDDEGFFRLWAKWQDKVLKKMYKASNSTGTQTILWTSGLTHPDRIEHFIDKTKYIIQIWSDSKDETISGLLQKGYQTIFSNVDAMYLDCGFQAWLGSGNNWCSPIKGWQTIYDNDPQKIYAQWVSESEAEEAVKNKQIIGSETALWSEQADDNNLESRIWPRAAAHAERVWSHPTTSHSEAEVRMVTNRNRMVLRGIRADRLQPEYCLQNEGRCYAGAPQPSPANSAHLSLSTYIFALVVFSTSLFPVGVVA